MSASGKNNPANGMDYGKIEPAVLATIAFQIFLIREFEQVLLKLSAEGCVHGPVHTSIGQEACAAGAMAALDETDKIFSTHRAHHHYLARATGFYSFDPSREAPPAVIQEVTVLLGEVMGLSIGCCGGRGGSMHLRNEKIGVIGTDAIVAGGLPLATGAAYTAKYRKEPGVVIAFLGDGAVNQGAFHEALNLAGLWKLPIIYFIENNAYAVATAARDSTVPTDLAGKAAAYGIRSRIVDGMNPLAVMAAVHEAKAHARRGNGPTLLEAKCYRYFHHAGAMEGSAFGYRTKKEEQAWKDKDPWQVFPRQLIEQRIFAADQMAQIKVRAGEVVSQAVDFCTVKTGGKHNTRSELWPEPASLTAGLRGDGSEFAGIDFREIEDFSKREEMTYVQAIAAVTERHLENDAAVLTFGEEVANFGGGAYGATKGLPARFPGRVFNTPISECGFVGLAGGMAMCGLRPIVEIMFPDFALVAADQLFNQIGKLRHIYGNTLNLPLVVRTRVAVGCGYGGQHSMDPVGLFALFPGWRIVAPSNAFDYIGLFNTAMKSLDPVLIIEHHSLYNRKSPVPQDNRDYFIPFGKARLLKTGNNVTVVCYSSFVALAVQAAEGLEKEGIQVEVIDLRTVSPADVDYAAIECSLMRTGALVIIEQAARSQGIADRLAAECQRRCFDFLDAPIVALSGADVPNPVSKVLEEAAVPGFEKIKEVISRTATRKL